METNKQYDFSSLNTFFNEAQTPQQLADDLVVLAFNYAILLDDYSAEPFRNDMSTLYLVWQELKKIK